MKKRLGFCKRYVLEGNDPGPGDSDIFVRYKRIPWSPDDDTWFERFVLKQDGSREVYIDQHQAEQFYKILKDFFEGNG